MHDNEDDKEVDRPMEQLPVSSHLVHHPGIRCERKRDTYDKGKKTKC